MRWNDDSYLIQITLFWKTIPQFLKKIKLSRETDLKTERQNVL